MTGETPLCRDRDFRRYWMARTVSFTGSMVTYVVMPVLVYRMTGSGLWTASVTAAESLPYLCFGLFAGALADRGNRQRLMVGADLASAAVLLTVPAAYLAGALTPVHVVAVAFAVQALFVFFDAANFGALTALAGRERLAAATSAVHATTTVLELTLPMAAGVALVAVAPATLLAVDAASFVGSALLIRAIRRQLSVPRESGFIAERRWRADIAEGLVFLVRHPVVRVHTVLSVVMCVSFGIVIGQLVPWADRVLGVPADDARLGMIFAAWGLGGLMASLAYPSLARAAGEIRVTLASLPVSAAVGATLALAGHWLVAMVLFAAWAGPASVAILNVITLRAKVTPDRLQSRVNTTGRMLGFGLGTPIGAVLGGLVTQGYGPRAAFLTAAGVQAVAVLVAWLSSLRAHRHDPAMATVAD